MSKEWFKDTNFRSNTLALIALATEILEEYARMGYDLTVRQLYYQLVARGHIPNKLSEYNKLKSTMKNARNAGLIDWDMIVDRTRLPRLLMTWNDAADRIRHAARSFRIDKWADQPNHVEVMVEKQALEGVLIPVCDELQVTFTSNKGYSSASAMYRMGKRYEYYKEVLDKNLHILYLGDHDPSGLDMDRDIEERVEMYSSYSVIYVDRLALLMSQIEEYQPPENPTKLSDSRSEGYITMHGYSSWELDALEPRLLADLVRRGVMNLRDDDLWDAAVVREKAMRDQLIEAADNFEED